MVRMCEKARWEFLVHRQSCGFMIKNYDLVHSLIGFRLGSSYDFRIILKNYFCQIIYNSCIMNAINKKLDQYIIHSNLLST